MSKPADDKAGKSGAWKKLLGRLQKIAPGLSTVLDAGGDIVGGPVGIGLEALARLLAGVGPEADMDDVAEAISKDPSLMVKMEELALERERAYLQAEVARQQVEAARIESVNATMRAEAAGEDKWTRRWRPFWGFISGGAWGLLAVVVAVVILGVAFNVAEPEVLASLAQAFDSMVMFWAVALAVLGVSAYTRGTEKITRAKRGSSSTVLNNLSVE